MYAFIFVQDNQKEICTEFDVVLSQIKEATFSPSKY